MNILSVGWDGADEGEMKISFEEECAIVTGTVLLSDMEKVFETIRSQRPEFTLVTPAFRYIWPDAKLVVTSLENLRRMRRRNDENLPRTPEGWLKSTQQGISSRYLMSCMGLQEISASPGYPIDAQSFGLCTGMLKWCRIPAEDVAGLLQKAVEADTKWGAYVEHWATLTSLPSDRLTQVLGQMAREGHTEPQHLPMNTEHLGVQVALDPLVKFYQSQLPGTSRESVVEKIVKAASSVFTTVTSGDK